MVDITMKIKAIRIRRGLSQADMGTILGISQAGYMHKETGKRSFSIEEIIKICNDLKIDPSFAVSEMSIDAADLEKNSQTSSRDSIIKNLDTLNDRQLAKVDEFISSL